jgi:plasmid stabilization system protein ParE
VRIVLHGGATADLEAAEAWYHAQKPGLGIEMVEEVHRGLEYIADNPLAAARWPDTPMANIRRYVLSHFPFALAYLVEPSRIVILAVAHTRRNPRYWLDRLGNLPP